ncbi:hypothetical protein N4R57_10915 [Rhodobacteraceae bacterium D3-12]|nr:hypothetical protein N4R57_10915 [Rhodobacteraceae bacterium D3-12]
MRLMPAPFVPGLTLALGLALVTAAPAQAETLTLRTVDFKLPSDLASKIPRSVKKSDVFVSSENCYYVRKDLSFVFIGCIG